jgi:hypothetical protein
MANIKVMGVDTVVFDSTIDNTFDITAQWITATATESIQFRNILINKY